MPNTRHAARAASIGATVVAPVGSLGIRWTPYYRATWAVEARATTAGRIEVAGEIGVRLW